VGLFTRSRERRYKAAMAVYLAAYTYQTMTLAKRQEVDGQVYKNLDGKIVGASPFEFQRLYPSPVKAACRAFAMNDLGIPPAIEGEKWNLPNARRLWGALSNAPFKLHADYRPMDEATIRAQSYLEAKGIEWRALDL
jgi:hypothetical protein